VVHLQKILGYYSITMTMRYAPLGPDFVEEATRVIDGHNLGTGSEGGGEKSNDFSGRDRA
jgi:hypothetical protein